jgi:hypothetical protein
MAFPKGWEEFCRVYPKQDYIKDGIPAFASLVASGVKPRRLIEAAETYRDELKATNRMVFAKRAKAWLEGGPNTGCWQAYRNNWDSF